MTNQSTDTYDLSICPDCATWWANADDSGFSPDMDNASVYDAPGIQVVVTGHDTHFSWFPCDACRRPFGGDRIDAVMMECAS